MPVFSADPRYNARYNARNAAQARHRYLTQLALRQEEPFSVDATYEDALLREQLVVEMQKRLLRQLHASRLGMVSR